MQHIMRISAMLMHQAIFIGEVFSLSSEHDIKKILLLQILIPAI
jgi:hypothetical protein